MEISREVWDMIAAHDMIWIEQVRLDRSNYKTQFLETSFESIRGKEEVEYFMFISDAYKNLALFADEAVKDKFKKLKISRTFLRWFTSLDKILDEFNKLEHDSNIRVLRAIAIGYITLYLNAKISAELMQWGGYVETHKGNPETSALYKSLLNTYRQRNSLRKFPNRSNYDLSSHLKTLIEEFEREMPVDIDKKKMFLDLSVGKTEAYYLRYMLEQCFIKPDGLSNRQFLIRMYEVLRVLVKDHEMIDYKTFMKLDNAYTFDTYRFRRVQNIIYRK